MREFDQKILRKLQLKELEILKVFDTLCRKHDIPYFIFYGAGIGAMRHSGFIPWDDDIDVLMLRKDYEKFLCVAKKEDNGYYLLTTEENYSYPQLTARWGPQNTAHIAPEFKNIPYKFPISMDIFPLDAISDDEGERKKQCFSAWFWQKLMLLRQIPHPRGLKGKALYVACGAAHIGMKVLHISPKWLYRKSKEACLRYENMDTQKVAFLTDTKPGQSIFSKDDLFPPQYLIFEGLQVPFPKEVGKLLAQYYGDYMQFPSEEEQRLDIPYLLDFGDGERYQYDE